MPMMMMMMTNANIHIGAQFKFHLCFSSFTFLLHLFALHFSDCCLFFQPASNENPKDLRNQSIFKPFDNLSALLNHFTETISAITSIIE
jgi:hypothetical protein